MLKYVEKKLFEYDAIKPRNPLHQFRNRARHSYRVYRWIDRLAVDYPDVDLEVCKTAAIFHDLGYAKGKNNHAEKSDRMFRKYAKRFGFDEEFTEKVSYIIRNHSDKSLIKVSDNKELILVLEADLLDEEGAMGLMWDLLSAGKKGVEDYTEAMDELYKHSVHILDQDYMVTPTAIKIWNDKKELVRAYMKAIKEDLFLED